MDNNFTTDNKKFTVKSSPFSFFILGWDNTFDTILVRSFLRYFSTLLPSLLSKNDDNNLFSNIISKDDVILVIYFMISSVIWSKFLEIDNT